MAYTKTFWKARKGTNLNRFTKSEETDRTFLLTNTPDAITEPGTPFSAENMNHIEEGIEAAHNFAGHPIGSYYTQFPLTGQSTIAGMFSVSESPSVLFGGTWTEMYVNEDVFFRTGSLGELRGQRWTGTAWATDGVPGIEPDATRNYIAYFSWTDALGGLAVFTNPLGAAVGENPLERPGRGTLGSPNQGVYHSIRINPSLVIPTSSVNTVRNRLIKVWKRTA